MATPVTIIGPGPARNEARVTPLGQLVTAPLEYSDTKFNNMDLVDTAYNFHKPTAGKRFVITGMLVSTNRSVGANGAIIEFYEASAVDSTTVDKTILRLDMVKNDKLPITGVNFILTEGVFLNGKTDDDDVLATIAGYEVDA